MARVNFVAKLIQRVEGVEEVRRWTTAALNAIIGQVNGRLDFVDNVRAAGPYDLTFNGTDYVTVNHNLGRTPVGFILLKIDADETVYVPAAPPWTDTDVFLIASGPCVARVYLV